MAGNLSRRDLLKAGAIITAVAGCTDEESRGQPAPAGQPEPVARDLTADVVVVGAGYAGLGAAWELFKHGQRVIVLEANSRVGGRVWSSQLSDGTLPGQAEQFRVAAPGAQQMALLIADRLGRDAVRRFGPPAAQLSPTLRFPAIAPQNPVPDTYFEFNWSIEEFARGDFAAVPGPGVLTGVGFCPALRAPFGRIHWASVDTATFPYASFSGAVQSGKRTAAEVLAAG